MGILVKKLGAGAISVALIGCGGGSEPDSKLTPSAEPSTSHHLSGVVMDGYLVNANVCLDKNKNSICDSDDGEVVKTNSQGKYELPVEGSIQGYSILVEAVANLTVDLDNPNQTITKDFTLESPATHSEIVSPMTSMIASLAQLSGESFDQAARTLAGELNVSEDVLKSDYVSGTSSESQQIHMLARGITRVIQSAQDASKDNGVTEEFARKGAMNRLATLDLTAMKQRTDKLSHGAQNSEQALEQIAIDYRDELKVDHDDIQGNAVTMIPRAPKNGVVNDSADTFDWTKVKPFHSLSDYEYSLNGGVTWNTVTQKPISVGESKKAVGEVQVRVAAKTAKLIAAGKALKSSKAFTETQVPAAPTRLVVNDANNTFDWQHSAGFLHLSDYEFTINGGRTWQIVNAKPQKVADIAIAAGDLKLRVREDLNSARPAGLTAKSAKPMTVTPTAPSAPALLRADDDADLFEIQLVAGFDALLHYEVNLGSGWQPLTSNPYVVGNVALNAKTVRVRVKANPLDGRPIGTELIVAQAFTKVLNKPTSPTTPVVDDANNQFGWTIVSGYQHPSLYELSTDGGQSFQSVTTNPQSIPDINYHAGKVCVRVKAGANNATGSLLCNDKPYTVTPAAPAAPTNGIVNDAANTFDWAWVAGFDSASDYEVSIESGDWTPVANKPVTLQDRAYAQNSIQVRVKANPVNGRPVGAILSNHFAFTEQPDAPNAPTSLMVDDNANTLDWTNVSGFSELANYEWSVDSGSNWSPVIAKPIIVGDIAKAAGVVQIRVRANSQNGMPAGAAASNPLPFTETPKLPAPTGGEIKVVDKITTNLLDWTNVNSGTNYNQPQHYEFTTDQGATWQTVVTKPQFVGPRAFDKNHVGIRVKRNAITGKVNPPSNILWATNLSGQFAAIQYVPMKGVNEAASSGAYDPWLTGNEECIAEYSASGSGEPTYWTVVRVDSAGEVRKKVEALTLCGINKWQIPSLDEVIALSKRSQDTLPSYSRSYLIDDSNNVWAETGGEFKTYKNGVLVNAYYGNYAFVKWHLASSNQLLSSVNTEIANLDGFLSQQSGHITQANTFISTWLSENKAKQKNYLVLSGEAKAKQMELEQLLPSWLNKKAQLLAQIEPLTFQAKLASQSRTDTDSMAFVTKVAEFRAKVEQLKNNNDALIAIIEATKLAQKVANVQSDTTQVSTASSHLQSAATGSDIHQATLALFEALHTLEQGNTQLSELKAKLNLALASLSANYSNLVNVINNLLAETDVVIAIHNVDSLKITAKDGFVRAQNSGYQVSQSSAMIDTRFAKLDVLGGFLPKSATYAQGWRCVLDTSVSGKKRVWTLLQDGLPKGKDELVYNATGADLPSLLGAGGRLEQTNKASLCGYTDWKVPSSTQLESLASASVSGLKESTTIDVKVFPHHRALLPTYDKETAKGGKRFYYWTSRAKDSSNMYAHSYATASYRTQSKAFDTATVSGEAQILVARLIREDVKINKGWTYLTHEGAVTTERALAKCAKYDATGYIWQIYQDVVPSKRFVKYSEVSRNLSEFNSKEVCGKSNWSLPTSEEMKVILSADSAIFEYASPKPKEGDWYANQDYYLEGSSTRKYQLFDPSNAKASSRDSGMMDQEKYLFRFISK